jgi:hypothetical protein
MLPPGNGKISQLVLSRKKMSKYSQRWQFNEKNYSLFHQLRFLLAQNKKDMVNNKKKTSVDNSKLFASLPQQVR